MITIINYGIGNLTSVKNMLKKAGAEDVRISDNLDDIAAADKLILPGVGHFDYGMKKLHESGLIPILEKRVMHDKIPILGICLGAKLWTKRSDEGENLGLGWVDGETVNFDSTRLPENYKIPHMGWNYVIPPKKVALFALLHRKKPRIWYLAVQKIRFFMNLIHCKRIIHLLLIYKSGMVKFKKFKDKPTFTSLFDRYGFKCVETKLLGKMVNYKYHFQYRKIFYSKQFRKWLSPICPICGYQGEAHNSTVEYRVTPESNTKLSQWILRKAKRLFIAIPKALWPKEQRYYWIIGVFEKKI